MRSLSKHLYELASICTHLNNEEKYESNGRTRVINTSNFSQWLKLASQMKSVEIDAWAFPGIDAMWCRPAAEALDAESEHFTNYSTPLTKFIFIYNALEELYKMMAHQYDSVVDQLNISKKMRMRSASLKSSKLLELSPDLILPVHFEHLCKNYLIYYEEYDDLFGLELSKATLEYNGKANFAIDLIRNLRNHIAHGVFPIIEDPDYGGDYTGNEKRLIMNLLGHSCRLAALYIQLFLSNFNTGINSGPVYAILDFYENEIECDIDEFFIDYISKLHIEGEFGFNPEEYEKLRDRIEY